MNRFEDSPRASEIGPFRWASLGVRAGAGIWADPTHVEGPSLSPLTGVPAYSARFGVGTIGGAA